MINEILGLSEPVNARLKELIDQSDILPPLKESMSYSLMAGGKRIRPILNILACELKGGELCETLDIACAIEMIHTYSLIHDDLPAMDNDTLRRGKPTSHVVFGEANAILTGDALLNFAFETMINHAIKYGGNQLLALKEIAYAAGACGMIAGQYLDLAGEHKTLSKEELLDMHGRKTGALLTAPLKAGLLLTDPSDAELRAVTAYGQYIGLAFQVNDDILDVTGSIKKMGKTLHKDEKAQKNTYVSMYGLSRAKQLADEYTDAARESVSIFGEKAERLTALAVFLNQRKN